ncbi:hypothetical protein GCM10009526_07650 [Glutamicibacter creatinolyticus]
MNRAEARPAASHPVTVGTEPPTNGSWWYNGKTWAANMPRMAVVRAASRPDSRPVVLSRIALMASQINKKMLSARCDV